MFKVLAPTRDAIIIDATCFETETTVTYIVHSYITKVAHWQLSMLFASLADNTQKVAEHLVIFSYEARRILLLLPDTYEVRSLCFNILHGLLTLGLSPRKHRSS